MFFMLHERCILTLKTMMSAETLERLLGTACRGPYAFALDGTEDGADGARKVIRITFENENDRERFRAALRHLARIAPRHLAYAQAASARR